MIEAMSEVVRVDFSKPMPLFPLPDTVLLPHAVQPLHIFESRYHEMVNHCLDGAGQIAMACFEGSKCGSDYSGMHPIRPVVCIGQIVQHESLSEGRHNILLHGVCRAKIEQVVEPDDDHQYRMARLAPIEALEEDPPPLEGVREELRTMLKRPHLRRMRAAKHVAEWFDREDVSTLALLELIGSVLLHDCELKYLLLAEPSPDRRADIILSELHHIDRLIGLADRQNSKSWPKGLSLN